MTGREQPVVACVPVAAAEKFMPNYLERATAENGPYTLVNCPQCHCEMYLGQRSEKIIKQGIAHMLCMPCCIKFYGAAPLVGLNGLVDP
jgi:hypothetical protein